MNQDINYALISALYTNKNAGLYNDVYFPIIKYTIVQLYNQKHDVDASPFYLAKDAQDYILSKFKIKIPEIVITKSLKKIAGENSGSVELELYDDEGGFRIKRVWDSSEFDELSEHEARFSKGLDQIEEDYRLFLSKNGTYDDGVSFLQFISDNTEEVLGYFQNDDKKLISEKYVTIVFFLEELRKDSSKKEEFIIVEHLFWASIIAGFLRSDKPKVNASEDGGVKEYFLDTAILMGMLGLSSKEKEVFCQELGEIIKSSGGVMKLHPMTAEEIKKIITSVESKGCPDPGTDISQAWINHKLNINKIAKKRLSFLSELNLLGVQLFPLLGPNECRKITKSYEVKQIVKDLAAERSIKPRSYSQDLFREVHDIFMDDFIKGRRKERGIEEDSVFVTYNTDLINFTKMAHPEECYMVSSGRVVLELWMHNVKPSDISCCALTETMARCLDQHNIRVRNKIAEVSRYFNENNGNFDPDVYKDFIMKLYMRAKNVILAIEDSPTPSSSSDELKAQKILDAIKADRDDMAKIGREEASQKAALQDLLDATRDSNELLIETQQAQEKQIESLEKTKSVLEGELEKTRANADENRIAKELAEETVALYKARDIKKNELETISASLMPLERERLNSFKNYAPGVNICMGILSFTLAIAIIVAAVIVSKHWMITIGPMLVGLGVYFFNRYHVLMDTLTQRRQKAFDVWERNEKNAKYICLITQRDKVQKEIEEINQKINQKD